MDNNKIIKAVKAAHNGESAALETLYSECAKQVYYLALKIMRDNRDAEDITQEVFIAVCEKIGELKEPKAFGGWLNRITANKCADAFRKKGNSVNDDSAEIDQMNFNDTEESDPLLIPEKSLDNAETARMIVDIVDRLPAPQRLCVYYYYYEQMNIAQIAKVLDTNENTVKKRLYLARDKIRKELERLNGEEGIKLYSALPFMLTPALKMSLQNFEMPNPHGLWNAIKASATSGTTVSAAATTRGAIMMGIRAKIALAVLGIAAVGGIAAGVMIATNSGSLERFLPNGTGPATIGQSGGSATSSAQVGSTVQLGGYDWRILDVQDGKALVLSEKTLTNKMYHSAGGIGVTWEKSEIREWLNGEFYDDTFTPDEKEKIIETKIENKDNQWYGTEGGADTMDKVFLLSLEEVVKYFGDSGWLANKPDYYAYIDDMYNEKRIAKDQDGNDSFWWLRSPGYQDVYNDDDNDDSYAAAVGTDGIIQFALMMNVVNRKIYAGNGGVRPALWLEL